MATDPNPTTHLLPCPFCGGEAKLLSANIRDSHDALIECSQCEAGGPIGETDAKAIAHWNGRGAVTTSKAQTRTTKIGPNQYRCGACGGVFDKGWSDEEAAAELAVKFPGFPPDDSGIVCDDCYKAMGFANDD